MPTESESKILKDVDLRLIKFHRHRRMFCIVDDLLLIAMPNLPYSHSEWFTKAKLFRQKEVGNIITRGFVDTKGDIYFYKGYFGIDERSEKEMLNKLPELVSNLGIHKDCKVYGGLSIGVLGTQWKPKKYLGTVGTLLKKS